jgi:putative flippase GtrA
VPRQLFWFMLVGALSTVLQTIVYVSVRDVLAATWASWLALLVVTPVNTEAHRRVTFNVTTSAIARLHGEAGLTSVVVYLANLGVAPWFAGIAGPHPSSLTESLILALTGSLVGGVRYVILRSWVFAARRHTPQTVAPVDAAPGTTAPPTARPARRTRRNSAPGRPVRPRPNAAPATAGLTTAGLTTAGLATSAGTNTAADLVPRGRVVTVADRDLLGDKAAGPANGPKASTAFPAYPSTGNLTAALACLGTFAPIPTASLCMGQSNTGVLNQRPAGRLRTWHRNRRQHLTARS